MPECAGKVLRYGLGLRTRINPRKDRIALVRIKIKRLPHHPVKVGLPIRRLDGKRLRKLKPCGPEYRQVGALQFNN